MSMQDLRTYGTAIFNVTVIHGGPGAPGYMAPVARELSSDWGVLEPLQTATSLEGQLQELRAALQEHADLPVTLIGSSWGAMLGYIFAARWPALVKKLILVGSAVYEEKYAGKIQETRSSRLDEEERREAYSLMESLNDPATTDKNTLMARLGALWTKADAYNPLTLDTELLEAQYEVNQRVWQDAQALRRSGKLLELGKQIQCPVVAIHGDYDPHPPEGVQKPLSAVLKDFRFVLLKNCGHLPWIEREARQEFYTLLRKELSGISQLAEMTTWDGKPVSSEPPHGATIVVYRRVGERFEFLILHRAHLGPDYEGDWAWTPPAGARYPGEPIDACAVRELQEETGLAIPLTATEPGSEDWAVFLAEAGPEDQVTLDAEHDRCAWVPIDEAVKRCSPDQVGQAILEAGRSLEVVGPA